MTIPEAPTTQPVTIEGTSYDVPTEFLCPITLSIMEYPMMTRGGLNYDREAILSWLATHGTCPLTRQPMTPRNLVSNHPLKNKIVVWKREHLGADSRTKSADKELRDLFTAAAFVDVSAEKQTEILQMSLASALRVAEPFQPPRPRRISAERREAVRRHVAAALEEL